MNLEQLQLVLQEYFGEPFLDDGHVSASLNDFGSDRVLEIKIGRREVGVTVDGRVLYAGTSLLPDDA